MNKKIYNLKILIKQKKKNEIDDKNSKNKLKIQM